MEKIETNKTNNGRKAKLFGKRTKKYETEEIMNGIRNITESLKFVRTKLNTETNEALIDSYIYEIFALNKKYQYFINYAREKGITSERIEGFEKIS